MLKRVRIQNFKSLADVTVDLEPVTVLIGRSGSGKSNFVEALRWLRDYLLLRNDQLVQQKHGSWLKVMSATTTRPMVVSFALDFSVLGFTDDFAYEIHFQQQQENGPPQFVEERLRLGKSVLFHQRQGKWLEEPHLHGLAPPSGVMLGALTGVQEVTIAHLALTSGIGCYAFPDSVLARPGAGTQAVFGSGLTDDGDNFLQTLIDITVNLQTWHHLRNVAASLRRLKSALKAIDLQQPQRQQIVVTHEVNGKLLVFDVGQESEGFRRLFACLIALYQSPPKLTLIFDEPEKGIYPAGLSILADEFNGYASKGRGQVILTTHSPDFLGKFAPEQIRVVEMHGYSTHVGPVSPEQLEALRDHFMKPSDLLTVDEARLEGSLAGAS